MTENKNQNLITETESSSALHAFNKNEVDENKMVSTTISELITTDNQSSTPLATVFKKKVNCLITLNTAENIKAYTKFQEEYNNVLNESIQVNHHIDRYNKDHRELKEDISQLNAINIISTLLMLTRL